MRVHAWTYFLYYDEVSEQGVGGKTKLLPRLKRAPQSGQLGSVEQSPQKKREDQKVSSWRESCGAQLLQTIGAVSNFTCRFIVDRRQCKPTKDRREILKFSARYLAELRVRAPDQQCIIKIMNKNKNRKKPKPKDHHHQRRINRKTDLAGLRGCGGLPLASREAAVPQTPMTSTRKEVKVTCGGGGFCRRP